MPQVTKHDELESWLYDSARKYLSRRRGNIHVSDLLTPRKRYWAEILPRPSSNAEIGYFLAGRAHEEVIASISSLGTHDKVRGEWEGIRYEIDRLVVDETGQEIPVEFKTTRKPRVVEAGRVVEDLDLAVTQLACYVAARGQRTGYLLEFYLKAFDDGSDAPSLPRIVAYQIDWTEAELDSVRDWMRLRRDLTLESLVKKDHTILPECPSWLCGRVLTIYSDPYCPSCGKVYKVGEEKEDGTKRGVVKKCETCKQDGKRVELVRPSEEKFSPSCRWLDVCRPTSFTKYLDKEPKTQDNESRQEGPP